MTTKEAVTNAVGLVLTMSVRAGIGKIALGDDPNFGKESGTPASPPAPPPDPTPPPAPEHKPEPPVIHPESPPAKDALVAAVESIADRLHVIEKELLAKKGHSRKRHGKHDK